MNSLHLSKIRDNESLCYKLTLFKDLGQSLSLLTSALEVLNQYCLQSGSNSQTNRIKNVIHHEMLSAKVQREQNKQDGRFVSDCLPHCGRLFAAVLYTNCHHHFMTAQLTV